MSVSLSLTFYKKKLHKQDSFIFLTYFALFCNLQFYIHTYNNDMFMELFKLKVKGTTPSCIDFCPKFGNYQITIFCRNRIVTPISPNFKQVLIQILFHPQWIRKQIPNGKRFRQSTKYFCKISKFRQHFRLLRSTAGPSFRFSSQFGTSSLHGISFTHRFL